MNSVAMSDARTISEVTDTLGHQSESDQASRRLLRTDDAPANVASLQLDAVTLERRGMRLLSSCTLTVKPGQILSVMGPSGAGKTTLLRTIAGLAEPSTGTVIRPVGRVAMVFQDPRLLPWRTTLANVEVVLPKEQRPRARAWLERVGLGDALHEFPAKLSGGMRQRVAIARALACDAAVVLVDEPFASLDADTASRLQTLLTDELRMLQRPVVWVTHNDREAHAVATETLVMDGPPNGSWHVDTQPNAPQDPPSRSTSS